MTDKSGKVQVSSLIYRMGPELEMIFSQVGLAVAEANSFNTMLGRFDSTLNQEEMSPMKELTSTKETRKKGEM